MSRILEDASRRRSAAIRPCTEREGVDSRSMDWQSPFPQLEAGSIERGHLAGPFMLELEIP
jgi:hypothetical protein